ncbi:hypothetical protein JL720_15841 [Aureococcus anophagefferens]|nr:hypothetical protein JL720_15841 [Aureococcus anophagefferens]
MPPTAATRQRRRRAAPPRRAGERSPTVATPRRPVRSDEDYARAPAARARPPLPPPGGPARASSSAAATRAAPAPHAVSGGAPADDGARRCFALVHGFLAMLNALAGRWGLLGLALLAGPVAGYVGAHRLDARLVAVYAAFCARRGPAGRRPAPSAPQRGLRARARRRPRARARRAAAAKTREDAPPRSPAPGARPARPAQALFLLYMSFWIFMFFVIKMWITQIVFKFWRS